MAWRLALALAVALIGQPPSAPVLGVSGDAFTVDGQSRFLVLVSYFDALDANDAALEEDFGNFASHGVDGVRIFANWWDADKEARPRPSPRTLMDASGALRPPQLERLRHVLARAATHRLVVDLTFTRETVRDGDRLLDAPGYERGLIAVTRALKDQAPHVLFDLQNEVEVHGFGSSSDTAGNLARVRPSLRQIDPARLLVASTGSMDLARRLAGQGAREAAGDAIAFHDPRVRDWWRRTGMVVRAIKAIAACPIYLQEPTAYQQADARPGRDDANVEHFQAAMRAAREAGAAAWVFHTRKGFRLDERSFSAQAEEGDRAFLRTLAHRR